MTTSTDLRAAIEEVNRHRRDEEEVDLSIHEPDWATRIEQRLGALPWWIISAVVHAVLFLLITLLAVALPPPIQDEVIISTNVAQEKPPEYDEKKPRDIFKNPNEIQAETTVENPILLHEQVEVSDHFETDNDMDQQTSRGQEDAISDIPLGGTGISGSIGVGGGGMAGCFGYRNGGGRKNAVGRFGGSPATESAVEAALQWLARHQDPDGSWKSQQWEASANVDPGATGLAVLAFLGAGYTHKSGKFSDNVKRAVDWIVAQQGADGCIAPSAWRVGYQHACCGLALAEAYGMSQDEALREPAQKAVDYSTNVHQVPYSGWRYRPKEPGDTSVTGWFVMQLKSAKIAGLKVDSAGFQGATKFIDDMTTPEGTVGYTARGNSGVGICSVAMVGRQFMGATVDDPNLVKGAALLAAKLPAWPGTARKSFYYWYYGTLAMFQMGGDNWKQWNEALKPVLIDNQRKGGPLDGSAADVDGSWDPNKADKDDTRAGRVYTTAVGALCLEVYYRYLPMYAK